MKTPEEIKKGLECCTHATCNGCPYAQDGCATNREMIDALEYIQQLEKEHDALLADLRDADMLECAHCAHYAHVGAQCEGEGDCLECDYKNCACNGCWGNSNWEWRGAQEGEYVREF